MKRRLSKLPTQVRLTDDLRYRLDSASSRFRLPSSELVRRALEFTLHEWEQSGELTISSKEAA